MQKRGTLQGSKLTIVFFLGLFDEEIWAFGFALLLFFVSLAITVSRDSFLGVTASLKCSPPQKETNS